MITFKRKTFIKTKNKKILKIVTNIKKEKPLKKYKKTLKKYKKTLK